MKALVLSDTHIPHRAKELPQKILGIIQEVDLIIHAGDFTTYELYIELSSMKDIFAVYGNMDDPEVSQSLQEKIVIEIEGKKIGIIHGSGAPIGIRKRIREKFGDERLDAIVYGHTHKAFSQFEDGVLLFNPGSPTDRVFAEENTFGVLDITKEGIKGEIFRL